MTTARSLSHDIANLPSIVAETRLLQHFAKEGDAYIFEREGSLNGETYFLTQAQRHKVAGFGRAPTKRKAHVKAVAEFYERRLMHEVFSQEFSHVPRALQTSNGFAIHFSEEQAVLGASLEVIERHLLQYSFFKTGWSGFEFIKKVQIGEETLTFVGSKYSINDLRAGMVLTTSKRFPGISFGYFAGKSDQFATSTRWSHAVFEATDKIEPFLKLAKSNAPQELMPIEQGILNWMMTPHEPPQFVEGGFVQALSNPVMKIETFNLSDRWNLDFPLYGAYSWSEELIPLLIMDRFKEADSELIRGIFDKFDLSSRNPGRNPVL